MENINHNITRGGIKWKIAFTYTCCIIALLSCENFLEIDPPKSNIEAVTVFSNDITATSAVLGIYANMMDGSSFANGSNTSTLALAGLAADELNNIPETDLESVQFEKNSVTPSNTYVSGLWSSMYKIIYQVNAVLEGVSASTGVSANAKNRLTGEALFIRAFCNFYLVNLWGDVPLVTTTDYQNNALIMRNSREEVFDQIKQDLMEAQAMLGEDYIVDALGIVTQARTRPNKYAATALLARVYLYLGDWANAEIQSSNVINNTTLFTLLPNLNQVFLKNSKEAIWQLRPLTSTNSNNGATREAVNFSPTSVLQYNGLTADLMNAFESGDNRKAIWSGGTDPIYYPKKYLQGNSLAPVTEYSMVFRLAEQYLIRAEARVQLNNLTGAIADVDVIRGRALLPLIQITNPGISNANLLLAIEQERRVELFTEWGHRWFDLKRWNRADAVLSPIKGASWQATDVLFPLPQNEMDKNPNLNPQNSGY